MLGFRTISNLNTTGIAQRSFYGKAQIGYDYTGHRIALFSYGTLVCWYDSEEEKLHRIWGGYSATTMKHICAFCYQLNLPRMGKLQWEQMDVENSPF